MRLAVDCFSRWNDDPTHVYVPIIYIYKQAYWPNGGYQIESTNDFCTFFFFSETFILIICVASLPFQHCKKIDLFIIEMMILLNFCLIVFFVWALVAVYRFLYMK